MHSFLGLAFLHNKLDENNRKSKLDSAETEWTLNESSKSHQRRNNENFHQQHALRNTVLLKEESSDTLPRWARYLTIEWEKTLPHTIPF